MATCLYATKFLELRLGLEKRGAKNLSHFFGGGQTSCRSTLSQFENLFQRVVC